MLIKSRKKTHRKHEIVYRDNKPVSVIIDIDEYNEMLERLDDIDDLEYIKNLKEKELTFKTLEEYQTKIEELEDLLDSKLANEELLANEPSIKFNPSRYINT